MQLKFIGQYTGGRTSITLGGVTFNGRDPSEVPAGNPLLTHREFEVVGMVDEAPPAAPKPRGRPRKA